MFTHINGYLNRVEYLHFINTNDLKLRIRQYRVCIYVYTHASSASRPPTGRTITPHHHSHWRTVRPLENHYLYFIYYIPSKVFNISCAYHHLQKLLSGFLAGFQTASVDGRLFAVDARENFPKIPYQINSPYNFKKKVRVIHTCCISISYIIKSHIIKNSENRPKINPDINFIY